MRVLLDTHIALWAVADTKKLSGEVIKLLESEQNEVFYSVASVWEIAIKYKLKPEQMPVSEKEFVDLCDQRIDAGKSSGASSVVGPTLSKTIIPSKVSFGTIFVV